MDLLNEKQGVLYFVELIIISVTGVLLETRA